MITGITGITAARAYGKAQAIKKERARIMDSFARNPREKHRATIKIVQMILLNGPYFLNGKLWEVKSKSLGAGIYELRLEKGE